MKKLIFTGLLAVAGLTSTANAQIQKGNWMVGGQIADAKFTNGFRLNLTPQVGYFIKDNWAVGGEVDVNVASQKNAGTTTDLGLGVFTRYYLSPGEIGVDSFLKHGRFFGQANVGFKGINQSSAATTNGVGLGFGAGYAYFLTPNVGIEGLLKFEGVAGGGNQNFNGNLGLRVGFQIYLPSSKAKQIAKDLK